MTFLAVLQTNLVAPVMLARLAASALSDTGGSIVNLVDILAERPIRHHLGYIVSKAALAAATRALAVELAPAVRVNAIAPGIALLPRRLRRGDPPAPHRPRRPSAAPAPRRRSPGPSEYLLDDAPTMTGQVLTLDAGRTVRL